MAVEIREISTRSGLRKFIEFGNDFYKDCDNFCPHLVWDEMNTFNPKKNPAHKVCDHVLYMAFRDDVPVGRVAGIINYAANEHWGVKQVRFGWIDFIDDEEVSRALLDEVVKWGKGKGMESLNGPLGFTDFDFEGLLMEGYEYLAPMASLYNYPYYVRHMETYGMIKENDWIEFQIYPGGEIPERLTKVDQMARERYNLRTIKFKNIRELKKKYGLSYMDVLDEAYQKLYNFQPLTSEQKKYYANMYFPLVNMDFVTMVVNDKDEIVGVGLGMPDISKALKRCRGHLFPFGWYYILKALHAKQIETFDLLLIGVRPDYQGRGVNAVIITEQYPYFIKYGIKRVETTSIMETNFKNQTHWEMFDHIIHKRRRAFVKAIKDAPEK